jgi:Fur family transcriptional regulator, ferric uptake regulator
LSFKPEACVAGIRNSMVKIGQRQTRQRAVIHDIIMESARPLTIANLVEMAQQKKAKIGQATVYRTVNTLLEAGEIKSVQMPGGEALYEKADLHHHHHFKCTVCAKVYDLPGCPDGVDLQKFLPKGFKLATHDFTFYGTCAECA